jgi:hypothetical protein
MTLNPPLPPDLLADFRAKLRQAREEQAHAWESSSRLVGQAQFPATRARLIAAIQASSFAPPVRDALLAGLHSGTSQRIKDLPGDRLKHLTGLPTTKALRALCLLFGLAESRPGRAQAGVSSETIEAFVRSHRNPFDLLLKSEAASVLDLGAGDLTFAAELAELYLPRLVQRQKPLILHSVDRLQPGSRLGGLLQPDQARIETLQRGLPGLEFQFWGNQDMFDLQGIEKILPSYTLATCYGPPTPTVAYEPARISAALIEAHLRETKGRSRKVRVEGEEALEVLDGGRSLLFPPWKFDIQGPLALLDLLADKGQLCLLGAVDNEVFWEILSQLLADVRFRPRDVLFTPSVLPDVFGSVHACLNGLPIGQSVTLSDLADLREDLPRRLGTEPAGDRTYRFRHVEVRRGALFEGQPAGRTARMFKSMKEEAPPWMLILVPDGNAG